MPRRVAREPIGISNVARACDFPSRRAYFRGTVDPPPATCATLSLMRSRKNLIGCPAYPIKPAMRWRTRRLSLSFSHHFVQIESALIIVNIDGAFQIRVDSFFDRTEGVQVKREISSLFSKVAKFLLRARRQVCGKEKLQGYASIRFWDHVEEAGDIKTPLTRGTFFLEFWRKE